MNLNNKGITMVELLVCFLLISFISVALFNSVSLFSNKRVLESVKSDLIQYRNEVVKVIEDDLIDKGLIDAEVYVVKINENGTEGGTITNNQTVDDASYPRIAYKVKLHFRDNSTKELVIYSQRATDVADEDAAEDARDCNNVAKDDFYILYGKDSFKFSTTGVGSYIKYPLPNVGSYENDLCENAEIMDLRFGTIEVSRDGNVLYIYVGFEHPELGNDYSINIVAPMNYFSD